MQKPWGKRQDKEHREEEVVKSFPFLQEMQGQAESQ